MAHPIRPPLPKAFPQMTLERAFFPYGTQYHRAPTPQPDEWESDLREIARVGYTHVQYRPQWRWHERVRGVYRWDDLDRLFDLAQQNHVRVVLKPMLETAPDYVFRDLGATRIGFYGVPIPPLAGGAYYVGGWWPCFDNPQVVEAACQFINVLVHRYGRHPALWFYDAWNEPRSRPLGACHCPHSVRSYRHWLQVRYGSVEILNEALGKAWESFETIDPPAFHSDYVEMFLWRQWAASAVAQQVRFVTQAIRRVEPRAFVLVHVGASSVIQDPACDTSDDLQNAQMADRYGTSVPIFHHPATPVENDWLDFQFDWMRRVDPLYWCHEFYPNNGEWSKPPLPGTLAQHIWMSLAGGTAGFTFWQYRSERFGSESNGYGLREIDGSPTVRSQVADTIAGILKRYGETLARSSRPVGSAALLFCRQSDLLLRIEEMKITFGDAWLEGINLNYPYKNALHAAHVLYQGNGQELEWVVPGDPLEAFKVLHVTTAEIITAETAGWLSDYVRGGGNLIVEFPFACRDERTWVTLRRPCHGLEDLLGCREGDRVRIGSQETEVATFTNGLQIQAQHWRIDLAPCGAMPIARWPDGTVAAVRYAYGKGTVFALGINLSLAFRDGWDDPAFDVIDHLLDQVRAPRPSWATNRQLWVKRRQTAEGEIWFVFNLSRQPQTLVLPRSPQCSWFECDAKLTNTGGIELQAGGTWVGQLMPSEKG